MGRPAHAGARRDPRALRAGAAARRHPDLGLPARHDGDGEPRPHAEGGRRRRRALRVESALHAGRRGRGARRRVRHPRLRDPRRGRRDLLLAHHGRGRPPAAADDGRRRRRDRRPAQGPPRPARRHHRRHRGDHDRRHPAQGARGRRASSPSRSSRSTRPRPSTSSTTVTAPASRRSTGSSAPPTSFSPARRFVVCRLRLDGARRRDARARHGRAGDHHGGRSRAGARGVSWTATR